MSGAVMKMIEGHLAERPKNAAGEPVCKCGAVLAERVFLCPPCFETQEREHAQRQRAGQLKLDRQRAISGALATVPVFASSSDPELYAKWCRSKKFRAVGERYQLEHGNVVIAGNPGLGKTITLARADHRLVMETVDAGGHLQRYDRETGYYNRSPNWSPILQLRWTSALELARARERHKLGDDDPEAITDAIAAPVLCIDELGHESTRDPTWFLELMDARYLAKRITWITSGARPQQLIDRYGAGAWRRALEPVGKLIEDWSDSQ